MISRETQCAGSLKRLVGRRINDMKTQKEIDEINEQRAEAMHHLANAFETFKATGCSLGAGHISDCIRKLHEDNCVEY